MVPGLPTQLLGNNTQPIMEDSGTAGSSTIPPTSRTHPAPDTGANTRQHGRQLQRQATQIDRLTQDIKDLKLAIAPPAESFVIRHRSTIAHRGFQFEGQNHPERWRTPCGWRYGAARFFRVPALEAMHSRCKKCFDLPGQDSSDSEEDRSDGDESSSSSSGQEEDPPH